MLSETALHAALKGIQPVPVHGPFNRCIALHYLLPKVSVKRGGPPQPLWGLGSKTSGARFTPPNLFETVYLAEDMVTALTEVAAVVKTGAAGLTTLATNPWALISVNGVLLTVLDLTQPTIVAKLGSNDQELTGEWRYTQAGGAEAPTQLLGRVCYQTKLFDGIRYPSSKNPPQGRCVAVFPDRLKDAAYLDVYDPYGNLAQRLPPSRKLSAKRGKGK
jgi:RES domain-containing protein